MPDEHELNVEALADETLDKLLTDEECQEAIHFAVTEGTKPYEFKRADVATKVLAAKKRLGDASKGGVALAEDPARLVKAVLELQRDSDLKRILAKPPQMRKRIPTTIEEFMNQEEEK